MKKGLVTFQLDGELDGLKKVNFILFYIKHLNL